MRIEIRRPTKRVKCLCAVDCGSVHTAWAGPGQYYVDGMQATREEALALLGAEEASDDE